MICIADKTEFIDVPAPKDWMNSWKKRYEDEANGDQTIVDDFVHYSVNILAMILKKENKKNQQILEFACGTGKEACYLAGKGHLVTGFDALPNAIEIATKRAKELGIKNRVTLSIDNMVTYNLDPDGYDAIIAIQCLQYLFNETISKMRKLLAGVKQGGYFVYSGNILPHFPTEPPIRFIEKNELLSELDGWTIHSIATEDRLLKENDVRGFIYVVAQKPIE